VRVVLHSLDAAQGEKVAAGRGKDFAFPGVFRYHRPAHMKSLLALALLMALFHGCTRKDAAPRGTEKAAVARPVAIPSFDPARAFQFLHAQTSFGPRHPNSVGHERCLEYLEGTLSDLCDTVVLQPFTHPGYGETLRLTNVIARFRAELPARILLCAHWDTRPRADRDSSRARREEPILGANDGASGVAVLLELATLMKAAPPPVGVDIVLFDGEDYGLEGDTDNYLLGSRHFVRMKPADYVVRFGILLDMVGDAALELPREQFSDRYARDIVDLVWQHAAALGVGEFLDAPGHDVLDDHVILNQAGIRTIDIIDFDYPDPTNRYWHTHQDTPDKCSPQSLGAVGRVLTQVLYTQTP